MELVLMQFGSWWKGRAKSKIGVAVCLLTLHLYTYRLKLPHANAPPLSSPTLLSASWGQWAQLPEPPSIGRRLVDVGTSQTNIKQHAREQPIVGACILVFVACVTLCLTLWGCVRCPWSSYEVIADGQAKDVQGDPVWRCVSCCACVIGLLATLAAALLLRLNASQPIQQLLCEDLDRCACPQVFGSTVLIPTYQMFLTQFWLIAQVATLAIGTLIAKNGVRKAKVEVEIRGGLSVIVAGSVVDCSAWIWVPMLVMHVAHFFYIVSRLAGEGRNVVTLFHETYFTYFASGALSFLVFSTIGGKLCSCLVLSASREIVYTNTLQQAQEVLDQLDVDKDGFLNRAEFANVVAFYATPEHWPEFCQSWGVDETAGLNLEFLRRFRVLRLPFFDPQSPACSEQSDNANMEVSETLLVGRDDSTCFQKTLMIQSGTHNGLPMWQCSPIAGDDKFLKSNGVSWVFDCGYRGKTMESDPHGGSPPEVAFAEIVTLARVKHVRGAPFHALSRLKVKTEQTEQARALRSRVLGLLAFIMSPAAATHVLPAMVQYFYITIPLLLVSLLIACATAGVGEKWGDVHHSSFGYSAFQAGEFEGYQLESTPQWLMPLYTHVAGYFRKQHVLIRLVLMNMALTGLVLCVQFCFNYAMLRYLGYDENSIPMEEFKMRTMHCETCMASASVSHKLDLITWLA